MRPPPSRLRVISHNILSSALSQPEHLLKCRPEACLPANRMKLLQQRYAKEISANAQADASTTVFCLQEVHRDQASELSGFFRHHGFAFHHTPYNTSLGLGLAYPAKSKSTTFTPRDVSVLDAKVGGWGGEGEAVPVDLAWQMAHKFRHNKFQVLEVAMSPTTTIHVGNVHLPCAFMQPGAMTVHALVCLEHMRRRASSFVLAGDFNFKPSSPQYSMATTGVLPAKVDDARDERTHGRASSPAAPLYAGDPFSFASSVTVKSAYADFWGHEPAFTNYVFTAAGRRTFRATLDYIFYNGGGGGALRCVGAGDLRRECQRVMKQGPSLPNHEQGSDHLLLWADFAVNHAGTPPDVSKYVIPTTTSAKR